MDNMNYMYSLNANNGELKLLRQLRREDRPEHRPGAHPDPEEPGRRPAPEEVRDYGVTVKKSTASPLMLVSLYSPQRNLRRHLPGQLRLHQPERPDHPRAGDRQRHGVRRRPVRHAALGEARPAGQAQHHGPRDRQRHPEAEHGESGGPDRRRARASRPGVHLRHQGPGAAGEPKQSSARSCSGPTRTGRSCGSTDVARIELGSQTYNMAGRLNGKPSAVLALYQLPGTNAIAGRRRREEADGGGQARPSRPTWNTGSPSTPRSPCARGSRRSSRRCTRRCSW